MSPLRSSPTADDESSASLQPGGFIRFPRDSLVRMTGAGDEGEGARAAILGTAPRPQTLGGHRLRNPPCVYGAIRISSALLTSKIAGLHPAQRVPHSRCASRTCWSQPRHRAPTREPSPTAVPQRSTAILDNTIRRPAALDAAHSCPVANMVAVARSSGRSGEVGSCSIPVTATNEKRCIGQANWTQSPTWTTLVSIRIQHPRHCRVPITT